MPRLDRLDSDALKRIQETEIWRAYVAEIRDRLSGAQMTCANGAIDEREIRLAQGEVAALTFVLGLPEKVFKEIVRRNDNAAK